MKIEATIKADDSKDDYFFVRLKTYKQIIEGRFERNEIRHLIEILDNGIGVNLKQTDDIEIHSVPDERGVC
jgi:hypothetical protein